MRSLILGVACLAGMAGPASAEAPSPPGDLPIVPMAPGFANLKPGADVLADDWWRGFADPVLDDLVATALDQNFSIAEAGARLERARAGIRAADGARLPSVSVDGSAAAARLSTQDPQLGPVAAFPGFQRNQERYVGSIGASWEIDLFGRLGARSREARAEAEGADAGVRAAQLAVASEIAERYINLRLLQHRREVAQARATALAELARLAAIRAERGVSPAIEGHRLEAEARSAAAAAPLFDAGIAEQLARIDVLLAREVGTSARTLATLAPLPQAPSLDLSIAPVDLLERRPDVVAAGARVRARDAAVAAALRDRLPRFNLGGLLGTIAGAINPLFGAAALTAQGSAGFSYSPFDGGRSRAAVGVARADVAEAANAYQRTVLSAIADVEAASAARESAAARAANLRQAEDRLEEVLNATRIGEARGALALSDVLDVDRRLQDARDARLVSEAERSLATIALIRALGGGAPGESRSSRVGISPHSQQGSGEAVRQRQTAMRDAE